MGDLRSFALQPYVDDYNCIYYIGASSSDRVLDYATHFPFFRIYSLEEDADFIEKMRERYKYNPRLQLFARTHATAFYELMHIIPNDSSCIVWLSDGFVQENIIQLAQSRPAKKDVIIIDSERCSSFSSLMHINRYFGLTHYIKEARLGEDGTGIMLIPHKLSKKT